MKSGKFNFLEPSGTPQACNGTALYLIFVSQFPSSCCMLFLKLFNVKFPKINPFTLKTAKSSFQFTHFAVNQYIKTPSPPPVISRTYFSNAYLFLIMLLLSERVADKDCKPCNKIMLFSPQHRTPTG
jgi:hypothetical protein